MAGHFGIGDLGDLYLAAGATLFGTQAFTTVASVVAMPLLRMRLVSVTAGFGPLLGVYHGRRFSVVVRPVLLTVCVGGWWRGTRALGLRMRLFFLFHLGFVIGSGLFARAELAHGDVARMGVTIGLIASVWATLMGRVALTRKRMYRSIISPLPKSQRALMEASVLLLDATDRYSRGDDALIRRLAASKKAPALAVAGVAVGEGRYLDALRVIDGRVLAMRGAAPEVQARYRASMAPRTAEIALLAGEAGQMSVDEALARANADAGARMRPLLRAIYALLSGDPHTALRWGRTARRRAASRLDLADVHCTLAHAYGRLGDRARADEELEKARRFALPGYARLNIVRERLDLADPQVSAVG